MPIEHDQYHLDAQHLASLLESMILAPDRHKPPSPATHLYFSIPVQCFDDALQKAGIDRGVLMQQSVGRCAYIPITPQLKEAIEATSIMSAHGNDCFLKLLDSGAVIMSYQSILGSRSMTPPDSTVLDKVAEKIIQIVTDNQDFTHPIEVFRFNKETNQGTIIKGGRKRISALLEPNEQTPDAQDGAIKVTKRVKP